MNIQYLQNGKNGFTLIELLVSVIIIGILGSIALPSYLSQSSKAKATEARSNLAALLRAQQTYRVENGSFSSTLSALDVEASENYYQYAVNSLTQSNYVEISASAVSSEIDLKNYAGAVSGLPNGGFKQIVCESLDNTGNAGSADVLDNAFSCDTNSIVLD